MKRRILICGDRNWADPNLIYDTLKADRQDVEVVIHGAAHGADIYGSAAAYCLEIPAVAFPANWAKYGRAAGPIRNQRMLDEGRPTEVWAFHDFIEISRGTADMIKRATRAGIPVKVFKHNNGR